MTPLHLGELHAYEHLLVWLIAFGPFLALGVVVFVVRRRDAQQEAEQERLEAGQQTGQDEAASHP